MVGGIPTVDCLYFRLSGRQSVVGSMWFYPIIGDIPSVLEFLFMVHPALNKPSMFHGFSGTPNGNTCQNGGVTAGTTIAVI